MDIRLLPGVALTAIGQQLEEPDAASCRLALRQLAAVAAQQQPGSILQVVASSFQAQLQADKQQQLATTGSSTADAAAATGRVTTAIDAACPAGEQYHERGDIKEQASTGQHQQQQQQRRSGIQQPNLSSTASSLVRAAALLGYSCVRLHVDVRQTYEDHTWQQLFSALAACPSIVSLEVIEYASLPQSQITPTSPPPIPPHILELSQREVEASLGYITPNAARSSYLRCNWLPSLVTHLQGHLQQLHLRLQAALPPVQQPLLLQLQELRSLQCIKAQQVPLLPQPSRVLLLPEVVVGLSALQHLRSLTATMGPARDKELYVQAVLKLQDTFSELGSHLTHLSFGTGGNHAQLQLSAPLNRMPALQTLTCQPGFTLDAEDIIYPDLDPDAAGADLNSSSEAETAAVQLVPSLTRLVLNDGYDHGPLLQLLTQPSREGAAAAASRTLLQQLEFNSHGELPFELLNQLEGLRSLKFTAREKHDMGDFTKRAPALVKQLQGLTLLCSQPSEQHDEWAAPYRPVPLLTVLTSLTSLKVVGTQHVLLSSSEDLPLLSSALLRLQQLHFAGGFTQLRQAAWPLRAPSHSNSSSFVVLATPPQLTALTLLCKSPDPEERQTLRFMHGALPKTLRSLCIRGIASSVQAPYGDPSSNAAGWQVVPNSISSSSSTQQRPEGAGKQTIAAAGFADDSTAGSSSSSVSRPQAQLAAAAAPAESAGGAVLAALPLLERAEVVVESLQDAADMLRLSSRLVDLALELRPAGIAAGMQDMRLADDTAAAAAPTAAAAAQWWPQQLTSLRLCVPGVTSGDSVVSSIVAADARCRLQLLLPSLSQSLKQLKRLALTCKNGPCLPMGCQQALCCLSSLTRLQTLELNFACCSMHASESIQAPMSPAAAAAEVTTPEGRQQQQQPPGSGKAYADDAVQASSSGGSSRSSGGACCIKQVPMDAAVWVNVLAGLQHCSRLRQVVLGPERPIDTQQQQDLHDKLPHCLVYDV